MSEPLPRKIVRISQGRRIPEERGVVEEYPLRLRVNGRDLATLICSPHQLNFLVAGFFRLQGFVSNVDDLLSLGICREFGLAEVRLKSALPERLQPTLTSGCGTGIAFNLPQGLTETMRLTTHTYRSADVFRTMQELQERAEQYRSHGGIHSAAIGGADGLILYAEDIGRHNTLDRLAGEALFRQLDLAGKIVVTSGRVSTEMVVKAARLGIGLVASRTSPTDKAIDFCEQAGIALIGYVRGGSLEIYSHPQRVDA